MGEETFDTEDERQEWLKCRQSCVYFIYTYCQIYDATSSMWIPFLLWPGQVRTLDTIVNNRLVVILKARQLGLTWLCLSFILWKMLFHPAFTAVVFSRRETEAIYLLGTQRLRGIYNRLPEFMKVRQFLTASSHIWQLSNESVVYGFPTTAGDSYTAGFAFVDEADLVPDLDSLMNAVKPTIDGGGQMILLSRADKQRPASSFKRTYRGAKKGTNGWASVFLPWFERPERDAEWYEAQKAEIKDRTGAIDDLYQQYPATDDEALRPPEHDRRLPLVHLQRAFSEAEPLDVDEHIAVPGLRVFELPELTIEYVIGADPAEGNPGSNDSVACVLEKRTGRQVAVLAGQIEPTIFASHVTVISDFYNNAEIMPERNNHGHAMILALEELHDKSVLLGIDLREGWQTSSRSKAMMYTVAADILRENPESTIRDELTYLQLASVEGSTLKAPEGELDDHAVAWCLAQCAIDIYGQGAEYGVSPVGGYRG